MTGVSSGCPRAESKMSPAAPHCPNSAGSMQVNPFTEKGQTHSRSFCPLGGTSSGIVAGEQFVLGVFEGLYPTLKSAGAGIGRGHSK